MTPVTSSTKIMLMIDQNIIFCPALYLPTSATLCSLPFSTSTIFLATEYLFIRNIVVDETHEHKHQRYEDGNTEERMQNTSHLRCAEGLRQPL